MAKTFDLAELQQLAKHAEKRVMHIRDALTAERRGVSNLVHSIYAGREQVARAAADLEEAAREGDAKGIIARMEDFNRHIDRQQRLEATLRERLETSPEYMAEFSDLANAVIAVMPTLQVAWEACGQQDVPIEVRRKFQAALPGIQFERR